MDETFQISSETKPISHMAVAGGTIWLSLHNAAQLRCYNSSTREQLAEINITPQVTKMLHGKHDDIVNVGSEVEVLKLKYLQLTE